MLGIVREHDGVERDSAGRRRRVPQAQAQRLPFAQNLRLRPFGSQPPAVGVELQTGREKRADGGGSFGDHVRLEQPLGGRELEIVGHVEDVHDDRHVEPVLLHLHVEVAEGNGMRVNGGREREKRDRKAHSREPLHGVQW